MAAESHIINWRSSTVHYRRYGHGAEWLFCFHGYGEEGSSFEMMEEFLADRFSIIAIDMPFHGQTNWQEGLLFPATDLIGIINRIKPAGEPFSLLGYSMGGRVALRLLQGIPGQIKKVVVVAPDGLHKNKWQWLSTRTKLGNRLFAYTMRKPFWMFRFMDISTKLGLFNKSIFKFAHYYLDDAAQRLSLYQRWTTMREFRPDLNVLRKSILTNKIPVRMLFGKHDRVILTKHGTRFSRQAGNTVLVKEIEAGHILLKEKYASLIAQLLVE